MILVSLNKTWPMVLQETHPARREALAKLYTCYAWPVRPAEEAALARYADVLLGIHRGEVVTAYDITSLRREEDAERTHEVRQGLPRAWPRIVFDATPSKTWAHLIGTPCPAPRRASGQYGISIPARCRSANTMTARDEIMAVLPAVCARIEHDIFTSQEPLTWSAVEPGISLRPSELK